MWLARNASLISIAMHQLQGEISTPLLHSTPPHSTSPDILPSVLVGMGVKLLSEPSEVMLNLAALAYLLGISIITWCVTHATKRLSMFSRETWRSMSRVQFSVLMVLAVSWLQLCLSKMLRPVIILCLTSNTAGMVLYGASTRGHHELHRCSVAIIACDLLYTFSKFLMYFCLIERVSQRKLILIISPAYVDIFNHMTGIRRLG